MKRFILLAAVALAALALPTDGLAQKTISGTITTDTILDTVGGAIYEVTGSVTVNNGVTLTIEPGVVLKFYYHTGLTVHGTLTAAGGASQDSLIYFTSIKDDNAPAPFGDDTNGDGNATIPDNHDWRAIVFSEVSDPASVLEHCIISYGGYSATGIVVCQDASPTLEDCELTAGYYGVRCDGASSPILRNTSINAMTDVPIAIEIEADPVFDNLAFASTSDNGFDAIGILGGTLAGANTLRIRGATLGASPIDNFVYILLDDVTVAGGGTLTIDPGVVVKPKSGVDVFVHGELLMNGTADPDSQIVFTSFKDDNFGIPGDTNNDGSITSPAPGDWRCIDFQEGAAGSVTRAVVKFGGTTGQGMLRAYNCSPVFADLVLSDAWYGIEQRGVSASAITNCAVSNTTYTPFLMSVSADPTFTGNSFTNVGLAAVGLIGEAVGVDAVLRVRTVAGYDNITYWLNGTLTMALGAHLRIEPGVVVKVRHYNNYIIIEGSLEADATADSMIAFTATYDDALGNPADTQGNGTATTPDEADWGFIKFAATSDDERCVLDHCIVSYGGYYTFSYYGVVWCQSASPDITNCQFLNNRMGIRTDGNSEPDILANHFFNNSQVPLATSVVSDPYYADNTFDQNEYHAVGILSETLAEDAVLEVVRVGGPPQFTEYFPYMELGTLTIGSGATMRVEPGVVVKVRSGHPLDCYGGLVMPGTADSLIVYTAIEDDSYGGDSNVDGSSTSPGTGDWQGIRFYDTTVDAVSLMEHCLLRFGGYSYGVVQLRSASPAIRDCEFEINNWGLWVQNQSDPVVADNLFRLTQYAPISKSVLADPTFSGNVYDNNNFDCLGLIGEDIAQDLTLAKWDLAGYTNITRVLVNTTLTVNLGTVLTIEPGVVIKMGLPSSWPWFQTAIDVEGAIAAGGTWLEPVVFTSILDDLYGNPADTNNDGSLTEPSSGNWARITFEDVSDDAQNLLEHCVFRYGGYGAYGAVRVQTASPSFDWCTFAYNGNYGMRIEGDSQPVIGGGIFSSHTVTPIVMSLVSDPAFSGCHFLADNAYSALGILGETLAADVTWPVRTMAQTANIPYILTGDLTVGLSSILRIEPGVVIKPLANVDITVQRGLIAEGTADPESLIVFTSPRDDFYGGDTNNDESATDPEGLRWGYISIANEAIDDSTRFENCVFRFASSSDYYGALDITNANPQVKSSIFSHNGNGLNYHGAAGDSLRGKVEDCDIFANLHHGIKNSGMSFTVAARNCWWGHDTGPYDPSDDTGAGGFYNPGGLGDEVTDMVDYSGWRTGGIGNILLGDVSLNGEIRAYDASLVLQDLAALITLTPRQMLIADVNCSGAHSTLDASLILRYVAGLEPFFPCAYEHVPTKGGEPVFEPVVTEPYPGSEEGDFAVSLPSVEVAPGQVATVPIRVSGSGELLGHEYRLAFDPLQMSVEGVALLPAAAGASLLWNEPAAGELRIVLARAELLPVEDAVAISLRGAEALPGPTPAAIRLDLARLNEQLVVDGATGGGQAPAALGLSQNHPNPFNPSTLIKYAVPEGAASRVDLRVFDLRGRLVRLLVDGVRPPGRHEVIWDGRDDAGRRVSSGVYLYRIEVGGAEQTRKMVLVK